MLCIHVYTGIEYMCDATACDAFVICLFCVFGCGDLVRRKRLMGGVSVRVTSRMLMQDMTGVWRLNRCVCVCVCVFARARTAPTLVAE